MKKTFLIVVLIALLLPAGCGRKNTEDLEAATMRDELSEEMQESSGELPAYGSGEPSLEPSVEPSGEAAAAADELPVPAATARPTPAPTATPVPIVSGTYKDEDGSTLVIKDDGSVTYETLVTGTVNGVEMSKMLTFHGAVEGEGFSFTKVTFMQLDLTAIAAANGLVDGSAWQDAAWRLYLSQLG